MTRYFAPAPSNPLAKRMAELEAVDRERKDRALIDLCDSIYLIHHKLISIDLNDDNPLTNELLRQLHGMIGNWLEGDYE